MTGACVAKRDGKRCEVPPEKQVKVRGPLAGVVVLACVWHAAMIAREHEKPGWSVSVVPL